MKYLIVEDDYIDAQVLSKSLKKTDYDSKITVCLYAKDCLEKLKEQNFDCIFIDYFLPDMNGDELFERIQQLDFCVPIIIITGHGDETLAVHLMKKGVRDYIPKGKIIETDFKKVLDRVFLDQKCLEENQRLNRSIASRIKSYDLI